MAFQGEAPEGFEAASGEKYRIAQQQADSESALQAAQAKHIADMTPFEQALAKAQAGETTERAGTLNPLAQSQIAGTAAQAAEARARAGTLDPLAQATIRSSDAQASEAGARSGLYGDQGSLVRAQAQDLSPGLAPLGDIGSQYYTNLVKTNGGVRFAPRTALGNTTTPLTNPDGTPQYHARGTAKVMPNRVPGRGMPMPAAAAPMGAPGMPPGGLPGLAGVLHAAMGAMRVPGQRVGNQDTVDAKLMPGEAVVNVGGIKHIPGGRATIAKANAKGVKDMGMAPKGKAVAPPPPRAKGHFATGTADVPMPGQTTSNGSWEGPTNQPAPPAAPPVFFPVPSAPSPARTFGKRQA